MKIGSEELTITNKLNSIAVRIRETEILFTKKQIKAI